ncbi:hypothetical protein DK880_00798 [Candidatus Cardinium hertigii]|uniref:Uncharacterized protein n=1 Tax=Candidatus Cardinium hertigii TaxID=247481 RepID=A0A2Z3LI25_9BACT|nr:hypothetical protein DK880_00798 [Candidatus Cardinium hertigii]
MLLISTFSVHNYLDYIKLFHKYKGMLLKNAYKTAIFV